MRLLISLTALGIAIMLFQGYLHLRELHALLGIPIKRTGLIWGIILALTSIVLFLIECYN